MPLSAMDTLPWGVNPHEVIWCGGDGITRQKLFYDRILAGASHLVREVECFDFEEVTKLSRPSASITEVQDLIDRTEQEFSLLQICGIQTPPDITWHIFTDGSSGEARTLARLPIIAGFPVAMYTDNGIQLHEYFVQRPKIVSRLQTAIARYNSIPGKRLCDVSSLDQYVYGKPRGSQRNDDFYLVDIEPMF